MGSITVMVVTVPVISYGNVGKGKVPYQYMNQSFVTTAPHIRKAGLRLRAIKPVFIVPTLHLALYPSVAFCYEGRD